jgi:ElaB/YqjD/DUF883 family membrane-anchored ribosome-binding protein
VKTISTILLRPASLAVVLIAVAGCRSAYYSAWETFGKHKRDLLRDQVESTRNEQEKAKEEFKDALTRLKELTGFEGGKLEEAYRGVEKDYKRCKDRSDSINEHIAKIKQIANDLFTEWQKELGSYSSENLRSISAARLKETRQRYQGLESALQKSTAAMAPVLAKLKDQTLFLKHNLNAQAIGSLRGEVVSIEGDVQRLIEEMNSAITRADEFIKAMPE